MKPSYEIKHEQEHTSVTSFSYEINMYQLLRKKEGDI